MIAMLPFQRSRPVRRRRQLPRVGESLTVLQQEYWLIQAATMADVQRDQIYWTVAECWRPYVRTTAKRFQCDHLTLADRVQEGMIGAYNACKRYRLRGCWVSCVHYGVVNGIRNALHLHGSAFTAHRNAMLQARRIAQKGISNGQTFLQVAVDEQIKPDLAVALHHLVGPVVNLDNADQLADDNDLERDVDHRLQAERYGDKLLAAVAALPDHQQQYLARHHDIIIEGREPKRRRLTAPRTDETDFEIFRRLRAVMTGSTATMDEWVAEACHELHQHTRLTWQEIAEEMECADATDAHRAALYHASRHHQPPPGPDKSRASAREYARAEDCYRLAEAGHDWATVARMAWVSDAAAAECYARTYAYRSRTAPFSLALVEATATMPTQDDQSDVCDSPFNAQQQCVQPSQPADRDVERCAHRADRCQPVQNIDVCCVTGVGDVQGAGLDVCLCPVGTLAER